MGQEAQIRRMASRTKKASPPIMSQEFIIQNHGDILSCVIVLVLAGFMVQVNIETLSNANHIVKFPQATSPLAQIFAVPQYNSTHGGFERKDRRMINGKHSTGDGSVTYGHGRRDLATIFFYSICAIVVHAVIQEYLLDVRRSFLCAFYISLNLQKLQRKLHLSKTKTSKFNESGHLAIFAVYAAVHAFYIVNHVRSLRENDLFKAILQSNYVSDISQLWSGYPVGHRDMSFLIKVFYLAQLAYWVHQFPEFYFSKIKKDEMKTRSVYIVLYFLYIGGAYALKCVSSTKIAKQCIHCAALHASVCACCSCTSSARPYTISRAWRTSPRSHKSLSPPSRVCFTVPSFYSSFFLLQSTTSSSSSCASSPSRSPLSPSGTACARLRRPLSTSPRATSTHRLFGAILFTTFSRKSNMQSQHSVAGVGMPAASVLHVELHHVPPASNARAQGGARGAS